MNKAQLRKLLLRWENVASLLQAEEERPQLCGLYSNIFHLLSYVMVIFEQDFLKINIFLK